MRFSHWTHHISIVLVATTHRTPSELTTNENDMGKSSKQSSLILISPYIGYFPNSYVGLLRLLLNRQGPVAQTPKPKIDDMNQIFWNRWIYSIERDRLLASLLMRLPPFPFQRLLRVHNAMNACSLH